MIIRTLPTTLLQTFSKIMLNSKVIVSSIKDPNFNFRVITNKLVLLYLQYYLVDDTLEVREMHAANDGHDPFPVLIGRHKVPKDRRDVSSTFPAVVMELSEQEIKDYFTPKDFKLGETFTMYGRRFIVTGCDDFTKAFYYHHFGVTDFAEVDTQEERKGVPKMVGVYCQKRDDQIVIYHEKLEKKL